MHVFVLGHKVGLYICPMCNKIVKTNLHSIIFFKYNRVSFRLSCFDLHFKWAMLGIDKGSNLVGIYFALVEIMNINLWQSYVIQGQAVAALVKTK